jgi:hypothetical protein
VAGYLIDAIDLIGRNGHRLLGDYRFDPRTGLWRHGRPPPEAVAHLTEIAGSMIEGTGGEPPAVLGEEVLAEYLEFARELMAERSDAIDEAPTGLSTEFEALRWFHLPPECLDGVLVPEDGLVHAGGCYLAA